MNRPDLLYRIEYRLGESDWPSDVRGDTLYVFTVGGDPQFLAMVCPCGICKEVLRINLRPERPPFWSITRHADGGISLYPTVKRELCRIRFVIAYGTLKFRDPPSPLAV